MKTGKEGRYPESGRKKETRKTETVLGDCLKRDVEKAREKRSTIDKYGRSLRLLIENLERRKRRGENNQWAPDQPHT